MRSANRFFAYSLELHRLHSVAVGPVLGLNGALIQAPLIAFTR